MFGKPCWFRTSKRGHGPIPVCRQGWLYVVVWIVILVAPALALFYSGRAPEAAIWLLAAAVCLVGEARQLRRTLHQAAGGQDVLYIGDEPAEDRLTTRKYDFHLRQ